ncbi:hypothetical protein TWF506_001641 [Arthrobotrys conoides]|uniref:Uncharacterized protein n=1 Tax=Arthrobotrys conoides TaxID=74498 RepID=A0AAN8NHM3_9PEZI
MLPSAAKQQSNVRENAGRNVTPYMFNDYSNWLGGGDMMGPLYPSRPIYAGPSSEAGPSDPYSRLNTTSVLPTHENSTYGYAESPESSGSMGRVEPKVAITAEPRGALSLDIPKGSWTPCLKTSPNCYVNIPLGYSEFGWLRTENSKHFMRATGKLVNEREGISQSGFWIDGALFITTLHFGPWIKRSEQPTQRMLELYCGNEEYGFCVSTINHNMTGRHEDDTSIDVYLWKWNLVNDLAIFAPTCKAKEKSSPPPMIPFGHMVESDALFQYFDHLNGAKMLAIGYNNPQDNDLTDYVKKYTAWFPAIHGIQTDYFSLLWPHFKSVSIGSIRDIDPVHSELMVDCTVWKGFFGGPLAIEYEHPRFNRHPLVIGQIVSTRGHEASNRARFIPAGLRSYLTKTQPHPTSKGPGELGFPRISLASIQPPMEPIHSPQSLRYHAPASLYVTPQHEMPTGPPRYRW